MTNWLRKIIRHSPLGPPLRWLYGRISPPPSAEILRSIEDDRLTDHIMQRLLRPDSNCIDIGCFEGVILKRILEIAPQGRHLAFEPIPSLNRALRKQFPSVEILEVALGERCEIAEYMHVLNGPAYSGLRTQPYPMDPQIRKIQVQVQCLDEILTPEHRVDLIKIDVEGGELQVLRGAERTLRACRPYLVFEHGRMASSHYGVTSQMVFDFLTNMGYQISGLGPWLSGQPAMSVEEFRTTWSWNFIAHPDNPPRPLL